MRSDLVRAFSSCGSGKYSGNVAVIVVVTHFLMLQRMAHRFSCWVSDLSRSVAQAKTDKTTTRSVCWIFEQEYPFKGAKTTSRIVAAVSVVVFVLSLLLLLTLQLLSLLLSLLLSSLLLLFWVNHPKKKLAHRSSCYISKSIQTIETTSSQIQLLDFGADFGQSPDRDRKSACRSSCWVSEPVRSFPQTKNRQSNFLSCCFCYSRRRRRS